MATMLNGFSISLLFFYFWQLLPMKHHVIIQTFFKIKLCSFTGAVIMAALCSRGAIIILPCSFFLLSIFYLFLSSPNLSGRRLEICHTSTHGMALVRI